MIFPFQDENETDAAPALPRTSTGILSNRRPGAATSTETSGTATPVESQPRYSLLVTAKREAARQNLYSRFFRGPVLGPDTDLEQGKPSCSADGVPGNAIRDESSPQPDAEVGSQDGDKRAKMRMQDAETRESRKKKKGTTERVKKRTEKSLRKDEEAKGCNERKETKQKRKKIIGDTSEDLDVRNGADEERQRRRHEKKKRRLAPGCSDGEADKKRRKKKGAEPDPASNIPAQDMPISENPVYHRKKRRRKE